MDEPLAAAAQAGELSPFAGQGAAGLGSLLAGLTRFCRRQPLGAIGALIIVIVVLMAVLAGQLHTVSPTLIGHDILAHPGGKHWFGTNRLGNDVWSRVIYGARPSLTVGISTLAIGLAGGTVLGLIAGYFLSWPDMIISRIAEFLIAFPPIIIGIVVATAVGVGLRSVIISVSIVVVAATTRIIRGAVLQESKLPYVQSAQLLGASNARILFFHVLPNVVPIIIVLASTLLPAAILFEAALTFLGFGLPPGQPSWGGDLGGSARSLFTLAPWLAIFPGVALSLTILAFNLLGDALRDVLDPRLRGTAP